MFFSACHCEPSTLGAWQSLDKKLNFLPEIATAQLLSASQ